MVSAGGTHAVPGQADAIVGPRWGALLRVNTGLIGTAVPIAQNHLPNPMGSDMPRVTRTKSWAERMISKPPHVSVTDRPFAGIPAGVRLLISSPEELDQFLRSRVPRGTTKAIQQVRRELAEWHKVDATCPVSTSIFLRIVAEAAWDELANGASASDVAPFWRVVEPASALAKKLRAGPVWIAHMREAEAQD